MAKKLKPVGDHILIIPDKITDRTTESGLVVVSLNVMGNDPRKQKPIFSGVCVGIGPTYGLEGRAPPCQPGDRIAYGQYDGSPIEIDGERYVILEPKEVRCIIVDE